MITKLGQTGGGISSCLHRERGIKTSVVQVTRNLRMEIQEGSLEAISKGCAR